MGSGCCACAWRGSFPLHQDCLLVKMAQEEATDGIEASIVEYFYERQLRGHRCGYCNSQDTSMTNGMWAHRVAGQDYQDLIDRGWRRSGKYMYKPVMNRTCCPLYAIRCEALRFEPSKSQRRVANRMKSFLLHGKERALKTTDGEKELREKEKGAEGKDKSIEQGKHEEGNGEGAVGRGEVEGNKSSAEAMDSSTSRPVQKDKSSMSGAAVKKRGPPRPGDGPDPTKPPCRKAKEIRLEKREKKLAARGSAEAEAQAHSSTTGDVTGNRSADSGNQELSGGGEADQVEPKPKASSQISSKMSGKKTVEMLLQLPSEQPMAHRLETKLVVCYPPSPEFTATFVESYALYKKYQIAVHGDKEEDLSERSYRRFLCDTPLIALAGPKDWENQYGSFHLQYYLDGKLLMVAVMDILPTYLSSVYVYYDPDYRWLELGVYSALREIEMVRKLHLGKPEFQYYCMGYYVHGNQKMSYKGNYYPSFLLCPESYRYVPIEIARRKLDVSKYSCLTDQPVEPERVLSFLGGVLVLFERQVIPYMLFRGYYGHVKDRIVVEYASLVGKAVSQRMFLYVTLDDREVEDGDD